MQVGASGGTMETWQAALLVVVALAVGVAIPVLVQLTLALRSARDTLARAGRALEAATAAADRIERIAARLEQDGRLEACLAAMDAFARTAQKIGDTARVASAVGAAIGPAVGAAVRAWRSTQNGAPVDGSAPGAAAATAAQGQEVEA